MPASAAKKGKADNFFGPGRSLDGTETKGKKLPRKKGKKVSFVHCTIRCHRY